MKKLTVILFVVSVLLYFFVGRYQGVWVCSVFKVLPLLVLFTALLRTARPADQRENRSLKLCLAALVFSMMGDVFGEWKGSPMGVSAFVLQIASFAVAQVFYAVSFAGYFRRDSSLPRNVVRITLCAALVSYMVWFGTYVLSFVKEPALKAAVPVYVTLIGTMGLFAIIQCRKGWWLFIAGALLFICSDSIIAYRSFVGRIPQAGLLIMSTYYAAQFLLNSGFFLGGLENQINFDKDL